MALPIEDILPELCGVLAATPNAVVEAPPGAGKSTLLPLALLDAPWLGGRRVLMLEPRRLAARLVARRLAENLGEPVGHRVGFRVRDETRVSAATRLEVVTEGILTRLLQADPALEGIGAVLFDEFHERSLHADLGLALCRDVQRGLREDLRLVVMSATLDGAAVSRLLDGAPVLTSQGRMFPVETRHLPPAPGTSFESHVAAAIRQALRETAGDVLVFLPGVGEIRRIDRLLAEAPPPGVEIVPLYGDLPAAQQDRAVRPGTAGCRRVILSTAIAETSLTIEGVRVVVDGGLMRRPVFDPRSGFTRLHTGRVSLAAADQRRGRAGRVAPGVCYRLWPEAETRALAPSTPPEIAAADLAPLALELAQWGVRDSGQLDWLDPPPAAALSQAAALLRQLDALDPAGGLTAAGRALAALPVHPRLGYMMRRGAALGQGATACAIAALLEDRDMLAGGGARSADLRLRLEVLQALQAGRRWRDAGLQVREPAARRALRLAERWRRLMAVREAEIEPAAAGLLLAFAYPDRVARRRPGEAPRFVLSNGRGATLPAADPLAGEPFLAVAEIDGAGAEGGIFLAAPLSAAEIDAHLAGRIEETVSIDWDDRADAVVARRQRRLGALVLREWPLPAPPPERLAEALLAALRRRGIDALPWSEEATALRRRLAFLHRLDPQSWPDMSDAALLAGLEDWLGPHLAGLASLAQLRRLDLAAVLRERLDWPGRQALDRLAPTHMEVPTGSRLRIDYGDPARPVLAVRLQELFGLAATPRIADGRVTLTLHLLSPAGRPLAVTDDLARFWTGAYQEVRKEMRGRYPRHPWPEDPLAAAPTRRAKGRG